jgi:hypothetical protein
MVLSRLLRVFLAAVFFTDWGSPALASPCASLAATVMSEPMKAGEPVLVRLTLTSKMAGTVMIYEEVAAWDYNWEVEDAAGRALTLTKLGEHYADKSPHISVGRSPRKLAEGDSVSSQIDLNELVVFPGAGDYQVKFSRTLGLPDRRSCSVSAEPLRFRLEPSR